MTIKRRQMLGVVVLLVLVGGAVRFLFWGEIRAYLYRNYSEVRAVENSNWFDYPVGAPNARGYYRAQLFGGSRQHLGEDWNGIGGGNSDYGDPVYSVADGKVCFAKDIGAGWGKVIRIVHPVKEDEVVEAVYAHLAEMRVRDGERVRRGQVIGTIGDADGCYYAHLHFELRKKPGLPLGGGYGPNPDGSFLSPTTFIDQHRCNR